MAVFLSPGVFIEEVSTSAQVVEAVGTSTMAIVGWTKQGAVDDPQVVVSANDFGRRFGGFTVPSSSIVPHSVSAFFANGGARCLIVRVAPADAAKSDSCVDDPIAGEALGEGDGTAAQAFLATLANVPVAKGSVTVRWRNNPVGTISGEDPGTTSGSTITPAEDAAVLIFAIQFANSPITDALITINWEVAAAAKIATIDDVGAIGGADAAEVSSVTMDRDLGTLAITFAGGSPPDADSVRMDYDFGGPEQTATDDGAGNWVPATTSGLTAIGAAGGAGAAVDYSTGDIDITFTGGTDQPFDGNNVVVDYGHCFYNLEAANPGAWGNNLKVRVAGNENFLTFGTQSTPDVGAYSKFDVTVFQVDEISGEDIVRETFDEIVFDDVDDPLYFASFLNDNSDFVSIVDNGDLAVPATFTGLPVSAESMGAGTGAAKNFTGTLAGAPVLKTSIEITYTTGASVLALVADVSGNVTGTGLDTSETNTVDYRTGAFELNFLGGFEPDAATTIDADYVSDPVTSSVDYLFLNGSDGTLPLTRTVVSSPALAFGNKGMYALNRIDEIFQLVIPDFGGDPVVAGDQLDFAESRDDVFVILSTPRGQEAQEAADYKRITFPRRSKKASMYWPWVTAADPLVDGRTLVLPPLAHIAGIYARTDSNRNVGKAPGGTVDGAIRGITGLETNPGQVERDIVYPARINPLINTPQTGLAVWGVRTISPNNDIFRYVHASRLFMFVEKSVFNSTQGFLFENISSSLYTSIKATIDGFLMNLFNSAHFAGETPSQAFFSIVDATNNPPETVNQGQIIADIGIAPNRPGEFIRFRFAVKTLDS